MRQAQLTVVPRFGRRRPPPSEPPQEEVWEPPIARADRDAGDRQFLPPSIEILEAPAMRSRVWLGYAIAGLVAAAIAAGCLFKLPIYAIAPGQIEAAGGSQVVEPRQPGQVVAIRAKDGDHVTQGDQLVELNPTAVIAARDIIDNKLISLRAEMARWQAEISAARANPVELSPPVAWDDSIPPGVRDRESEVLRADLSQLSAKLADLAAQRHAKNTEIEKYSAGVAAQNSLIAVISKLVGMHEQLAATGTESKLKLLQAQQALEQAQTALAQLDGSLAEATAAIPVIDAEIAKTREEFITGDTQQLTAADIQADDLVQQLISASLKVKDMTVRAPTSGIVQATAVTTIGQVVKPGQQLMSIVPDGAPLEIQAYVLNADIGFVRPGQSATIKIDTFPYTRYGTIAGKVTKVYSDAIPGMQALQQQKNGAQAVSGGRLSQTSAAQQTSDLVFAATIVPAKSTIEVDGREVPLASGMSVVTEIKTGEQRVLSYILFPLLNGLQPPQPQ